MVIIIIYLLGIHLIPRPRIRRATLPRKDTKRKEQRREKKKEKIGHRAKPLTPTLAIDALIGEEGWKEETRRKNGSGRRAKPFTPTQAIDAPMGEGEQKEETGSGHPTQLPWTLR